MNTPAQPVQVRLPQPLFEFVVASAESHHSTKSQVLVEAVQCLRDRQVKDMMFEGYRAMGDFDRDMAEADMGAADSSPEW